LLAARCWLARCWLAGPPLLSPVRRIERARVRSVVTTTLSAAAGGITNLLLERFGPSMWCDHTWSVGAACNGILAGLVSITAGCSVLLPGSAVIAGVVGTSCFYFLASKLVLHVCKIDDPLDAFAVHGASGFFAVIFANTAAYPTYAYGAATKGTGTALAVALGTLMAEIGWVAGCSVIMFFPLKKLGLLRVSAEVETAGMDVSKHGGSAYETPAASVASA
jgi:Amt family ammonium transporter